MTKKFFCIGAHKTGTTSILEAFKVLNYNVLLKNLEQWEKYTWTDNYNVENFIEENYDKYTFFKDSPFNHDEYYKLINTKYSSAKFILTIRNEDDWFNSIKRWIKISPVVDVYKMLYGYDPIDDNKDKYINKYNKRNNDIIEYFKDTDKLLILHLETDFNWDKLCNFLNIKIQTEKFPMINVNTLF